MVSWRLWATNVKYDTCGWLLLDMVPNGPRLTRQETDDTSGKWMVGRGMGDKRSEL